MDFTLKEVIIGLLGIGIYIFNYFKTKANKKKELEAEQLQREGAALKLAEENKKQAEELAANLKKELDIAAEKLAAETARQLREKEQRDAEEAARLENAKSLAVIEDIDKKVRHAIKGILFRFRAQRGYVIHWSNGTETAAGLHLMKISFEHEALETYEVEPIAKYFKEKYLPEMFTLPMKIALTGQDYYLKDTQTELDVRDPNSKLYRDWLLAYRVKSTLWVPVKGPTGIIIAILVIQWFAPTHLDDTELSKIRDMKSEIENHYRPLQKRVMPPLNGGQPPTPRADRSTREL